MEIKLTPAEMLFAAEAGCMRQIENLAKGRQDYHGADRSNGWQMHIEGALCEMAVAKARNIYWHGKGQFRGDDAGTIQVRGTTHPNGCLLLHKDDADHDQFWLVTGRGSGYWVRGWMMGHQGKQEKYWDDPKGGRACYFVPQEDLKRSE